MQKMNQFPSAPLTIDTWSPVRHLVPCEAKQMDENRLSGTAKNLGGKAEEFAGNATGDAKAQVEAS
jgi:hypothetical protein